MKQLKDAVPVVASVAAGAALGHFAGKGKNLLVGAVLVLGADMIASKVKAVSATNLRVAGATAMIVTPRAASGSNQGVSDFAKDGSNRLKDFVNNLVLGTGLTKNAPFSTASLVTVPTSVVEGLDYLGEADYNYQYALPEGGYAGTGYGELAMAEFDMMGR
jgi:hypothetical protein